MPLALNEMTGAIATLLLLWGSIGLFPHLVRRDRQAAFWLASVVLLLMLCGAGRSLYWDVMSLVLGEDTARAFRISLGGTLMNTVWNSLLILAGYCLLRLLHLLIPEEVRPKWSIWTSPIFPAQLSLAALIRYLREIWRERFCKLPKE